MTDPDVEMVRDALTFSQHEDSHDALAALSRISSRLEELEKTAVENAALVAHERFLHDRITGRLRAELEELEKERDRWRDKCHAEVEAAIEETARLRRIEEAARRLGGIWDAIDATADDPDAPGVPWNVVEASLTELRTALEGSE